MISKLLLVRHGAPDYSFDGADIARPLSEAGIRSMQDALPQQLNLLGQSRDIQLWSSPAKRAQQTAEILAHILQDGGKDGITLHDDLYSQDVSLFITELKMSAGTVIAVGHVPFMEQLTEYLTGARIRFEKGAVACIAFPHETTDNARLEWFLQGPDAKRWETLIAIEHELAERARKIEASLDYLLENPRDPEALHAFRVNIRRARSLIAFIQPFQKRRQNIVIDTLLADFQHGCAYLREMDGLCARISNCSNGSTENLTFLFACSHARDNERTRVVARLGRRNTRRQLREALHEMRSIKWRTEVETAGLGKHEVRREFDALYAACKEGYQTCDFMDDEATHALRKRIKRLRYVGEAYADLLGEKRLKVIEASRQAQDELGDLCDARVDLSIIQTLDKRNAFSGVEADVKAFVELTEARIQEITERLRASQKHFE
ncbi:MAG: CHAD domain-containing protein [Atopobiaceae bacterium]|jgi:phosphohistidine phosphatase SixA/CHAD domain-containing protein